MQRNILPIVKKLDVMSGLYYLVLKRLCMSLVGMWLPDDLRPAGTSKYVQGVELPLDYDNVIPRGYELVDLPPVKMMVFQGEPFADEDFMEAIDEVWKHIAKFGSWCIWLQWAPEEGPRFQLGPYGLPRLYRGLAS